MPPQTGGTDLLDGDISVSLERLFDPYNMDHIPVENRLDMFKKRNLAHVRHYKAAVHIFGSPHSRTRYIVAPPMETPLKHRIGLYQDLKTFPEPPLMNSLLQPQIPPKKMPSKEAIAAQKEQERINNYRSWLSERKKLRGDLQNMGMSVKWLEGKCPRTELETRVLERLTRKPRNVEKEASDSVEEDSGYTVTPPIPTLCIPSPPCLKVLEKYLHENKLRLIDLFQQVDKNKNWSVSKEDFLKSIDQLKLPISHLELEAMLMALDKDLTERVEYQELAQGMMIWKRERRAKKRAGVNDDSSQEASIPSRSSSGKSSVKQYFTNEGSVELVPTFGGPTSQQSGSTRTSSSMSQCLEVPEMDISPSQYILYSEEAMADLRKQMGVLKKTSASSVIKVGYKAIDDHLMRSTLDTHTADQVADFRQKRLEEYYEILQICKEQNIVLTRKLLDKVLLYPPERPVNEIKNHLGKPGYLMSLTLGKSNRDEEGKSKKKSRSSRILRSAHPSTYKIPAPLQKQNLSTGRALVSHKIDCWMSFEEYCKFTSRMEARHRKLHCTDPNSFWPGHLLDKLRLCWPPYDATYQPPDKRNAIFREIEKTKRCNNGYDNNLLSWPINNNKYVQYGDCESFERRLLE